jgi:hypothetical protein
LGEQAIPKAAVIKEGFFTAFQSPKPFMDVHAGWFVLARPPVMGNERMLYFML